MDHSVAVGAEQGEVLNRPFLQSADMQRLDVMALDVALSDEPLATSERHTRVERKGADR